jgi:large subunit ribosomal protein L15
MQLHALKPTHKRISAKRIGRGGKRGTYSGRGVKGQKARAGHRIRPALRDLIKKLPKRRGYRFKTLGIKPQALNVSFLERHFAAGEMVSLKTLVQKKILRAPRGYQSSVKILGDGTLTKALTVDKLPVSASARTKIESAGGKIV